MVKFGAILFCFRLFHLYGRWHRSAMVPFLRQISAKIGCGGEFELKFASHFQEYGVLSQLAQKAVCLSQIRCVPHRMLQVDAFGQNFRACFRWFVPSIRWQ
jgi:hypothetical protein